MDELIQYLRKNLLLDFQGNLTPEKASQFLRSDGSNDAQKLANKLLLDKGVNEMMLVLADCLLENVQNTLANDAVRSHLNNYSQS